MDIKVKYKSYLQSISGVKLYNNFKSLLYSESDFLVHYLFQNHLRSSQFSEHISICDIGAGDGKRAHSLCNLLYRHFGCPIVLDFVEQSKVMCDDFRRAYSDTTFYQANIYTSEIEKINLCNQYDLIFLIHSIFCLSDDTFFAQLMKKLKRNGTLLIVTNSPNSFLAKLKTKLDSKYNTKRFELSDVVENLESNNIPYSKSTFDINWCFSENEIDEKLSIILQWLSLGEFEKYSIAEKIQILSFAKSMAILKMGCYFFSEQESILIVKNNDIYS